MREQDAIAFHCTTCEGPVTGEPVFHLGLAFCCPGCAADGPCTCSYDPPGAARLRRVRHERAIESDAWVDEPDEPGIPAYPPLRPAAAPGASPLASPTRALPAVRSAR